MAKRKRSKKSLEYYRRALVADLGHMLRCCQAGRLPDADGSRRRYIEQVLAAASLPSRDEICKQVRLANADREANKLWTIPPIDMTVEQLIEQRKAKDRERKARARRKARNRTREAYLASVSTGKPWIAAGIHKSTWYKRKARDETGSSAPQKVNETGFVRSAEATK